MEPSACLHPSQSGKVAASNSTYKPVRNPRNDRIACYRLATATRLRPPAKTGSVPSVCCFPAPSGSLETVLERTLGLSRSISPRICLNERAITRWLETLCTQMKGVERTTGSLRSISCATPRLRMKSSSLNELETARAIVGRIRQTKGQRFTLS